MPDLVARALLVFSTIAFPASAALRVMDDVGSAVELAAPARRIVSLAPHVTELLFAIGAGGNIVATVDYSDHPPAARAIPRIGGSRGLDFERILALEPDLIVGWSSGNPRRHIDRLRRFGLPVYLTQPRELDDIARNLKQLGRLVGMEAEAERAATRFTARSRELARRYADRSRVRVFYQVLDPTLITVNGEHLISEVMRLCGGENIFATLPVLAPVVSEEAVLRSDPDAIVAGGTSAAWREWEARWRGRAELTAVKRGALYFISADFLHRSSPRILDGAHRLCALLEDARKRRGDKTGGRSRPAAR